MKKLLIIALLLNCRMVATAQEQLSKKQLADKLFERYEYFKALNLYLPLADKNNSNVQVVERIAGCYRLINDNKNAENWYASAISYEKAADIDLYYYAESLLRNNKLKEAKVQYQAYYAKVNNPEQLRFKVATCDSAAKWMAAPRKEYTVSLEKKINSIYADWGTNYYGEKGIVFTSDRLNGYEDSGKQTDNRTGNGYFKLYSAIKDSVVLLPISTDASKIFNGDYHAGPALFNASADTAWITVTTSVPRSDLPIDKREKGTSHQRLYTRRLMLVMATKTNGVWGNFKNFAYNNIKEYSVSHAALSFNGDALYFTSDMPGGGGKTDIWYCLKQVDGSWSKPVNCGKNINTKDEEAFPVMQGAGTLIYASKGLPGMGGFDIFTAKGGRAEWSVPSNGKFPINSTADDFYMLTKDGATGYFSSNRDGGTGNDDIYTFKYESLPEPVKQIQPPAPAIAGPPKQSFKPEDLRAIIYYDLDKANIRPDAATELDRLVIVLKANPSVKVKLASYTDVRASGTYNIGLSKRRSEAAIAYLVGQGISRGRLSAGWFGKENLVNNCPDRASCTEAEHQLNRRTEIVYDGMAN
ncbi:OmpA family protein [Mucilaginibacter gilvus]|uniref:OmpA family protein n=1 Tax=Mucilaginibacter gilvus TaxID=2305909 RepID=A0A3S3YU15_9SPHI|nr:OmpA family protein [Mucilaginibacter gilvus]RWY45994.1 OmpA family protein [Mucilaginibacter gilvus]